ncbi:MAG: LPS assembly lipoprotein LptE [Burkholderiales bacterium]
MIIIIIYALSACGFQLRGDASLPFTTLYIGAGAGSQLQEDVRRAVTQSSVTRVTDKPADAEAQLQLTSEQKEKVIVALNSAGRVREFQLRYKVNYQLIDAAKKELIAPSELVLSRTVSFSEAQVLAKEQEEALLYRDMQQDAATQILRRLSLVKR